MGGTEIKTALPAPADRLAQPVPLPALTLRIAGRSERGQRANNEDRFLAVRVERVTTPVATNIPADHLRFVPSQTCWAVAVADGMGGHAAGEVASTLALSRALEFSQQGSRSFVSIGEAEVREIMARLESILTSVDRAVSEQGASRAGCAGMGTTLTAAAAAGDCLFVCHAGDSRLYLLRQGTLTRLTRDHTMAQELVDAGLMDADETKAHPAHHVLTQMIGRGDADFDLRLVRLQQADRVVLTTDGVTDAVNDRDIERLATNGDCTAACNALIERALEAGASDNVTVLVADVELQTSVEAGLQPR
jgi:serine/threonine protein phosphatase PrpC